MAHRGQRRHPHHGPREGDHYGLNGTKQIVTNGLLADIIVVSAQPDPATGRSPDPLP